MAKKIRFPLQMKDGAAVRTLDELREHFDLESVLGYFADGKLKTWLADRYYDEMAEKVAELSADTPDLKAKICDILGVDYSRLEDDTDFEALQRRNEKLRILREITTDSEILKNVDAVAFGQDELFDILDEAPEVIYLYGEKFSIPIAKGNITYIGVNNPEVLLEKDEFSYKENGISFSRVHIDYALNCLGLSVAEKFILLGQYKKAFPIVQKLAENGDARAMYHLARYYNDGYNVVKIDHNARDEWIKKAFINKELLSYPMYLVDCKYPIKFAMYDMSASCKLDSEIRKEIENAISTLSPLAHSGDIFAQCEIGYLYDIAKQYKQAISWYLCAVRAGYARAQYLLAEKYARGLGFECDRAKAIEWYRLAATVDYADAKSLLCRLLISEARHRMVSKLVRASLNLDNTDIEVIEKLLNEAINIGSKEAEVELDKFRKRVENM